MADDLVRWACGLIAAYGAYLCVAQRSPRRAVAHRVASSRRSASAEIRDLLVQAGVPIRRPSQALAILLCSGAVGAAAGHAMYGGVATSVASALIGVVAPVVAVRGRRQRRREDARDAWPALLEVVRVHVSSLGLSIPLALLAAGERAPGTLQPAFVAADREWRMSADFERTLDVWTAGLADPTADAIAETLLVAHTLGGSMVDERLRTLIEDRTRDVNARKDARAQQAGVRFARLFVLAVPLGMALVGLSIGDGRRAYAEPQGQVVVLAAFALLAGCWLWASRLLALPAERRVFARRALRPAATREGR